MNISIIGTGYVGLVTGACLADSGINVLCMDQDSKKILNLLDCVIPIYEPGLEKLVQRNLGKTLHFTSSMEEVIRHAAVIFIAVGTPLLGDGSADLTQVIEVASEIAKHAENEKFIVHKSTVPVGTGRLIKEVIFPLLLLKNREFPIHVISNPEFLREGNAVMDFSNPDRIILGAESAKSFDVMESIYEQWIKKGVPLLKTNIETAEMIKYASNTFLALKISFINEVANVCELCGADALEVAKGMGLDSRIGTMYLEPGPGFGGSCFHKDVNALITMAVRLGYKLRIAKSVLEVNAYQRKRMLNKIKKAVGKLEGKTITILGLAFKPETDDIRESPSMDIIRLLLKKKTRIKVYDPQAMENLKKQYPALHLEYCTDLLSACTNSDCIVLATPWKEFYDLNLIQIKSIVNTPIFIDLRNAYNPDVVRNAGFHYEGVGRL